MAWGFVGGKTPKEREQDRQFKAVMSSQSPAETEAIRKEIERRQREEAKLKAKVVVGTPLGRKELKRAQQYGLVKERKTLDQSAPGKLLKGVGASLRNVARVVPQQSGPQTRAVVQQPPAEEQRPRRHNFFEHRDPEEVYGDDGLTFFDSNKARGGRSTGSLFGFD